MPTETPGPDLPPSSRDPVESRRRGPLRRRPPMWAALLIGAFAVVVYAATDTLLRFASDQSESAPAGSAPAPGGAQAGSAPPGGMPATQDPAAKNDSPADDTNMEQEAEGPRRAAPAKPSEEEAPEFRESADNNISLPVDI